MSTDPLRETPDHEETPILKIAEGDSVEPVEDEVALSARDRMHMHYAGTRNKIVANFNLPPAELAGYVRAVTDTHNRALNDLPNPDGSPRPFPQFENGMLVRPVVDDRPYADSIPSPNGDWAVHYDWHTGEVVLDPPETGKI